MPPELPGTRTRAERFDDVVLDAEQVHQLDDVAAPQGARYADMSTVDR